VYLGADHEWARVAPDCGRLKTEEGRDWLETEGGRDWLLIWGQDWLLTGEAREWLQTEEGMTGCSASTATLARLQLCLTTGNLHTVTVTHRQGSLRQIWG
jgi:hypothetical protein